MKIVVGLLLPIKFWQKYLNNRKQDIWIYYWHRDVDHVITCFDFFTTSIKLTHILYHRKKNKMYKFVYAVFLQMALSVSSGRNKYITDISFSIQMSAYHPNCWIEKPRGAFSKIPNLFKSDNLELDTNLKRLLCSVFSTL